jgi:hypothetical protein
MARMKHAIVLALLLCACGARSALDDLREDTSPDGAVRDSRVPDAPVRDADPPDAPPVDAEMPGCVCTGAALLANDMGSPTAIAVDRSHVYWATAGCDEGSIRRVPKCGGPVEVLASDEPNPRAIAIDDERVYYYDACGSGLLRSVPKAGGPIRDYAITVMDSGRALAVGGEDLYFSDYGLLRIPKTGGAQTTLNATDYVYAIAADARGAFFIGPIGGGPTFGVFGHRPGDPSTTRLATPRSVGNAIAIDEETVSFSGNSGIARMPRSGGEVTLLAPSTTGWRIAVDERFVYWTVGFAGGGGFTVYQVPKSGGESRVIGEGEGAYVSLAVDERCVYTADLYADEIRSFPK